MTEPFWVLLEPTDVDDDLVAMLHGRDVHCYVGGGADGGG